MTVLDLAADFVRQHEGCHLAAYRDGAQVATIGYGHTGPEVKDGLTWTQGEAEAALLRDLRAAYNAAVALVHPALADRQWAAITSFVFNLGAGAFAGSTLLKKINQGDAVGAALEFPTWDHAGGVESKGLLIRRLEEAALFLKGS